VARFRFLALVWLASCAAPETSPTPDSFTIELVADFNIAAGTDHEGVTLGGISAVTYEATTGQWIALSDTRKRPRFYELAIDVPFGDEGEDEFLVTPIGVTFLKDPEGQTFAADVLDPEGIAETPWGTFLVTSEADSEQEPVEPARLLEIGANGRLRRELEIPPKFVVEGWPPNKGVRNNLGFEALTLSPDGSRFYVGVEETLLQDGAVASFETPGFCRIIELEIHERDLVPRAELVYPLGPVARVPGWGESTVDAGLVELIALSGSRLLALERIYIREAAGERRGLTRARIFLVDFKDATDVSSLESLEDDPSWQPVNKELLLDFDDIVGRLSTGFQRLDNFEAMGLGPELSGGDRSLLVVSDDNFQDTQRSAFLLFRLKVVSP